MIFEFENKPEISGSEAKLREGKTFFRHLLAWYEDRSLLNACGILENAYILNL